VSVRTQPPQGPARELSYLQPLPTVWSSCNRVGVRLAEGHGPGGAEEHLQAATIERIWQRPCQRVERITWQVKATSAGTSSSNEWVDARVVSASPHGATADTGSGTLHLTPAQQAVILEMPPGLPTGAPIHLRAQLGNSGGVVTTEASTASTAAEAFLKRAPDVHALGSAGVVIKWGLGLRSMSPSIEPLAACVPSDVTFDVQVMHEVHPLGVAGDESPSTTMLTSVMTAAQGWQTVASEFAGYQLHSPVRCPKGCRFRIRPRARGWPAFSSNESRSVATSALWSPSRGALRLELHMNTREHGESSPHAATQVQHHETGPISLVGEVLASWGSMNWRGARSPLAASFADAFEHDVAKSLGNPSGLRLDVVEVRPAADVSLPGSFGSLSASGGSHVSKEIQMGERPTSTFANTRGQDKREGDDHIAVVVFDLIVVDGHTQQASSSAAREVAGRLAGLMASSSFAAHTETLLRQVVLSAGLQEVGLSGASVRTLRPAGSGMSAMSRGGRLDNDRDSAFLPTTASALVIMLVAALALATRQNGIARMQSSLRALVGRLSLSGLAATITADPHGGKDEEKQPITASTCEDAFDRYDAVGRRERQEPDEEAKLVAVYRDGAWHTSEPDTWNEEGLLV